MMNRSQRRKLSVMASAQFAVVVHLVIGLGFMPLLQGLHTESDSHEHRYCAEHRQIEEIPRAQPQRASQSTNHDFGIGALSGAGHVHAPCAVLNGSSTRSPFVCQGTSASFGAAAFARSPVLMSLGNDVRSLSVLAMAPKHSPPHPYC